MYLYKKYHVVYGILFCLLFSLSGLFLYYFIFYYGALGAGLSFKIDSLYTCLITILVFNLWGFSLLYMNIQLSKASLQIYRMHRRLLFVYVLAAIFLLGFTYSGFVLVRYVGGAEHPFVLTMPGVVLLQALWFIETLVISLLLVEYSSRRVIELYREKQMLEKNALLAQYQALQNQLNPHFLFNNLSVLTAEIEYAPQNAVLFVQNLSDIYRYVLLQQDKMQVSLRDELNFFDAYLFLYQTRYGNKLKIINNIPEHALSACIPPLSLQLLVENVFKHNYMTEEHPMTISLDTQDDDRRLCITNTLREVKNNPPSGCGLENLSTRFKILCGRTIEVHRTNDKFTVLIPLLYD